MTIKEYLDLTFCMYRVELYIVNCGGKIEVYTTKEDLISECGDYEIIDPAYIPSVYISSDEIKFYVKDKI